ncbi:MAG TPA: pantoate--beta-alanine ligase [Patescibacteria group bacterium]|nr:pantoate--beta-alanine ligase [Patescibacteria group bacterium]
MKIIRSVRHMSAISEKLLRQARTTGFVPTMGALHEGHMSLIRRARRENERVVVSIFVNPTQFGAHEDFSRYPRDLAADARLCRKAGVDFIFLPSAQQMYPAGYGTFVEAADLGQRLCGAFRPGHFRGVATVVTKLFNIVRPTVAYFGQKDAQQALIIRRIAADLNLAVKIRVMPIVREKDGLALSSRNRYLNLRERKSAVALSQGIGEAKALVNAGVRDADVILRRVRHIVAAAKPSKIDYITLVDASGLVPVKKIRGGALLALAVWIGKTRLIDNAQLKG